MRSSNYENSTSQDWFNEDTSPSNKPRTKAPERLRKEINYRDRLNKKRKLDLLAAAEIRRHTIHGSGKEIITKNLSASWRQALRSDALNSINFEDKNISEETDLSEMASVAEHVFKKSPNVSRTKAALKTKKRRNRRKKRMTKRADFVVGPISISQISREDFRNKPNRPHPPEMEKTGHFTNTALPHGAIISYLLWVFLGSAALSLWAVLLDSLRSYIKSLCGQNKARMSLKDPEHQQIVVNSGKSI